MPEYCIDLTPFVREATLPPIAPANATKIQTLFGQTSAGTFSPYASDGSKQITLNMIDTEYSILDAIFYPWMKDINSPWWYKPNEVFDKWATPYPMAILEVQRPRMRYQLDPSVSTDGSRAGGVYKYYSYKFLGVKPTEYSPFTVAGGGQTNLLRQLTLTCDMCLVDLKNDARTTKEGFDNSRTSFLFQNLTISNGQSSNEGNVD